jgi:hypothetical protein
MAEDWLLFNAAVDLVRTRLNSSIGRAQATLRSAIASGEVRSRERWIPVEDDDVLVVADDYLLDVDPVPGYLAMAHAADHPQAVTAPIRNGVNGLEKQIPTFSASDLVDWLDRQFLQSTIAAQKTTTKRSAEKTERAKRAAGSIWGESGPPAQLPNKSIVAEVYDWLEKHGEPQDISDKVIRRAVGRK